MEIVLKVFSAVFVVVVVVVFCYVVSCSLTYRNQVVSPYPEQTKEVVTTSSVSINKPVNTHELDGFIVNDKHYMITACDDTARNYAEKNSNTIDEYDKLMDRFQLRYVVFFKDSYVVLSNNADEDDMRAYMRKHSKNLKDYRYAEDNSACYTVLER